jgi:hypothetical protein
MTDDRRIKEPVVADLSRSRSAYITRYRFPLGYMWADPSAAWPALREAMPWEALGLSAVLTVGLWALVGPDFGVAMGMSLSLGLVALQMMRSHVFLTPSRIVRQRGLFLLTRTEIHLSSVQEARVESHADGSFGDIILVTGAGEERLRAVADPEAVLEQLMSLRTRA